MTIVQNILGFIFLVGIGFLTGVITGKAMLKPGVPMDRYSAGICLYTGIFGAIGFVWGGLAWGWI